MMEFPLVLPERKVLIVSGSIPPDPCGVGDYSARLSHLLCDRGVDAPLVALRWKNFFQVLKWSRNSIVHIQYPSVGYGWSLLPQLLCLLVRRPVVTIHEYSQVHFLRKLAELPFLISARKIIVTTDYERDAFPRLLRKRVEVVPVAAAVSPTMASDDVSDRSGVVFFGLMRPGKGVEEFLELARTLRTQAPSFMVRAYSSIPAGNEAYATRMLQQARELGIDWQVNRSLDEVSAGLMASKYAYLNFPDGVSDRRSSFVAAVTHGVVVLTSKGVMTSPELLDGVVIVDDPSEACARVLEMEREPLTAASQRARTSDLAARYDPGSFIDRHLAIYASLG